MRNVRAHKLQWSDPTVQSCTVILHFHAFPTSQETARPREDAIPTILSGNKEKGTIT